MIVDDLFENTAGPEKCWSGYRKVGTKPGTGRNTGKRVNDCEKINEATSELNIGDPVIITGPVQFQGKTGDVRELGQDGSFVVVNLYNYGPHSFHTSDVSRNDYADSDDEEDVAEGPEERSQHRLWQMITDYEQRAKRAPNDIKKQRYLQMAKELRDEYDIKKQHYLQMAKELRGPVKEQGVAEGPLNEFEMPVGQATGVAAQTNNTPKKTYSVKVVGTFKNPTVFMAKDLWRALEEILPRDYPRTPYQQQYATDPQRRVIDDIRDDGFSIVKQGIKSLDIANTIASNFEARSIPTEVIGGGLYEDENAQFVPKAGDEILWRPLNAKMVPVPVTVLGLNAEKIKIKLQSPRLIQQYGGKDTIVVSRATSEIMPKASVTEADTAAERQQALLDRLAARVGLPAGSSMDEIEAAQQAQLNRPQPTVAGSQPADDADFAAGLAAAQSGQGPLAIMLAQPTIANDQRLLDTIASSYGLPAGLSAQEIQAQSRGALTQTAVSSIARALDLPPGLNRTQLLAAFKQQQGVAEAAGLYGPFTVTINTGERPKSRTKTKKFRREDDAILWAEDWFDNSPQYVYATAEITDPQGNVVWYSDETMAEANTDRIADRYNPEEFDDMVLRLKTLAGAGPLKTVWDPERRVYKNVPINPQQDKK